MPISAPPRSLGINQTVATHTTTTTRLWNTTYTNTTNKPILVTLSEVSLTQNDQVYLQIDDGGGMKTQTQFQPTSVSTTVALGLSMFVAPGWSYRIGGFNGSGNVTGQSRVVYELR